MEEMIEKVFEKYQEADFIYAHKDKSISIMKYGQGFGWDETIKDFNSIEELRTHLNE